MKVDSFRNLILVNYYKNNKKILKLVKNYRVNKYKICTKGEPDAYSLLGKPLKITKELSLRTFSKELRNGSFYNDVNPVQQFLSKEYQKFVTDHSYRNNLKIMYFDIEIAEDTGILNNLEAATGAISCISCVFDNRIIFFTLKKVDENYLNTELPTYCKSSDYNLRIVNCTSENEMLLKFSLLVSKMDIISGYNINNFDIPYIFYRCRNIGVDTNTFSPFFQKISEKYTNLNLNELFICKKLNTKSYQVGIKKFYANIKGVSIIDYIEIYRKYTLEPKESYSLDFIANEELKTGKIEFEKNKSFKDLYNNNYNEFALYNIVDSLLIQQLERKLHYINLVIDVGEFAQVNYENAIKPTKMWEGIILRELYEKNIISEPYKVDKENSFAGAYVKEPIPGLCGLLAVFDVASLYPNIFISHNISLDTVKEITDNNYSKLDDKEKSRLIKSPVKYVYFYRDKKGIIPEQFNKLLQYRRNYKNLLKQSNNLLNSINIEIEKRKKG